MANTTLVAADWQRRRGQFNHDWLKNEFLLAVGKMLNVLVGHVDDPEFLQHYPEQAFAAWDERQLDVLALINEVTTSLSPGTMLSAFEWSELATCEHEWLKDLVHELWLARHELVRKIAHARQSLELVGTAFADLRQAHSFGMDIRTLHTRWAILADQCRALARSIEQFPSEVGFT